MDVRCPSPGLALGEHVLPNSCYTVLLISVSGLVRCMNLATWLKVQLNLGVDMHPSE